MTRREQLQDLLQRLNAYGAKELDYIGVVDYISVRRDGQIMIATRVDGKITSISDIPTMIFQARSY